MINRIILPSFRWLTIVMLLCPRLVVAADCNCPKPVVEITASHPFDYDKLTLKVDGESVSNPYPLKMERDKEPPYRLSVVLAPDAVIECSAEVRLSFPHCTIEHRAAGSSKWEKGSKASIFITELEPNVYEYQPEYVEIRITDPNSDDTKKSPEPGSETELSTEPASVEEDLAGVDPVLPPGLGLEIPLGAALSSEGGYRSAGRLSNYGALSPSFAAPSSFQLHAIAEVMTGSPAQVRQETVTENGQITEKHFIAPYAVLRLRGWDGSAAVSFTGAQQSLVEVYEPTQYDATSKTFTGSPHSYYRVEIATDNGQFDGIAFVQSNHGVLKSEIVQVTDQDGLSFRHQKGSLITEKLTVPPAEDSNEWRVETIVTRDGTIVTKTLDTWAIEAWGNALIESSVDPDPDVEDDELVTYRSYYPDGRLRSVSKLGDSWTFHTYEGASTTTYSPWLSSTTLASANGVWNLPSSGLVLVRVVTDTIASKSDITYYKDLSSSALGTVVSQELVSIDVSSGRTTTTRYRDAVTGLKSYRLTYPYNSIPSWLAGRALMSWDGSGKATLYSYAKGDWTLGGGFVANSNGSFVKQTVSIGTVTNPSGTSVPGDFVSHGTRSRRMESITGPDGVVQENEYVYDSTSKYKLALTRNYEYESSGRHRPTGVKIGGAFTSKTEYVSPLVTRTWDQAGTMTETEMDADGEVIRVTSSGNGEVPAVTSTYSQVGRTRTTSVNSKIVLVEKVDAAGRKTSSQDATGALTTYQYANGGRTVTRTGPGDVTVVESAHLDGRKKSTTGSAVIPSYFTYAVDEIDDDDDGAGNIEETTRFGTETSLRSVTVGRNWDGSTASTTAPNPEGGVVVYAHTYDPNTSDVERIASATYNPARIWSTPSDSPADALGMHAFSGLETDNNGPVVAGNDRLSESDKTYVISGTTWCLQTVSKEFHTNGLAAAYTTTSLEALAPVAVTHATHGSGLRWTTSVTRGSRTITTHRDFFFSAAVSLESTDDSATTASPDSIATSIHGKQVSSSSFGSTAAEVRTYDTSGRLVRQVSPTGAITVYRYNEVGQLDQIQDHENHTTTYTYHPPNHHAAGRVWVSTNSAGETTETLYNERGQVEETTGTASYRVTRDYNTWGELSEMRTYRNGITGDLTSWMYDEATGLLLKKTDAAGKEISYSYYPHGSLKTRTSARGIVTTYSYDAFGDLVGINYGDTTPDVTSSRDRLGRPSEVVDASGTRTISYNSEGQDLVSYGAGGPLSSRVLDYTWDSVLRPTGYVVNNSAFASVRGYDSAGRLSTVTGSGSNHLHTWTPGTSTLAGVVTKLGSTPVMTRTLHHDRMQRLRGIETTNGVGAVLTRFGYSLDSVGRRIRTTRENGQAWDYEYDSRSQVTSGVKSFPDGSAIPGHNFSYSYDGIGNRTAATHGGAGTEVSYTPDALNRYANIETGGSRFVLGEETLGNAVTVNGSNAEGAGGLGFFWAKLDGDNATNPLWSLDTVVSNGVTVAGRTWTPLASVAPTYDFDGNLTYDGRWNYTWDAENRLIRMETAAIAHAPAVGVPRQRIDCVYDGEGRRVSKTLSTWNGSAYAFTSSSRYLYDGWNLIAEYSAPSATSTNLTLRAVHTWGADLSGSLQGAGGVGGLLSTELKSPAATCYPAYDGNGNVSAWVNTSGALLDRREYSPFGQLIAHYKFGSSATLDRLRYGFSTKYNDPESGLLYYGYRFYDPATGRWPSRDPIGEKGGVNLYSFNTNKSINAIDLFGLVARLVDPSGTLKDGKPGYSIQIWHPIKPGSDYIQDVSITQIASFCDGSADSAKLRIIDFWKWKDNKNVVLEKDGITLLADGWSSGSLEEMCYYSEWNTAVLSTSSEEEIDKILDWAGDFSISVETDAITLDTEIPEDRIFDKVVNVVRPQIPLMKQVFSFAYRFTDTCDGDGIVTETFEVRGDIEIR